MRGRIAGSLAGVVALSCPTACGTRVTSREAQAGAGSISSSPAVQAADTVPLGPHPEDQSAASTGGAARASSPVPLSTRPAARPATLQGRPPSTRAPVTPAAPDRPVADTSSNHLAAMDGPGVSPPDRTVFPPAGQKSPLRLASVGTYSGPVGTVMLPMVIGAQVWVKYINAKGGLNGHQVELVVYDDGGDPARHRSQVQEAIERKKVVAFLQNGEGLTGRSSVDYVTGKRVPVIGSDTSQKYMYTSPMYFPQVTSGEAMLRTIPPSMASQVRPRGAKNLGTLVCAEITACEEAAEEWAKQAKTLGIEYVYRARASLAQPDYTAECLAAKSAEADILFLVLDQNSLNRVATASAATGLQPDLCNAGAHGGRRAEGEPEPRRHGDRYHVVPLVPIQHSGHARVPRLHANLRPRRPQRLRSHTGLDVGEAPGTSRDHPSGTTNQRSAPGRALVAQGRHTRRTHLPTNLRREPTRATSLMLVQRHGEKR